jgi:F-type H+-transporting ATPase subunit b
VFKVFWRTLRPYLLACFAATLFFLAQAHATAEELTPQEKAVLDRVSRYKVINFSIFAVLLGYALYRYSPRFFNARSADIQKAIKDATGLKLEADYRYSEIDRRMANLTEEVKRMRDQAASELEREHAHIRQETQAEVDHIHRQMLVEIDALTNEAAFRVRRKAAQIALGVAERKLAEHFAGGESPELMQDFIHLVEQSKN